MMALSRPSGHRLTAVVLPRDGRLQDTRKVPLSAPAVADGERSLPVQGQSAGLARRAPVRLRGQASLAGRREAGRCDRGGHRRQRASASRGRKSPCRTARRRWSPASTGGGPRRGSRTSRSKWMTLPGSPKPLRTGEPGALARPRRLGRRAARRGSSISTCARWPRRRESPVRLLFS